MIISQVAEQEFYDELDLILRQQSADWQAIPSDQKELLLSRSDFQYYMRLKRQNADSAKTGAIETDADGLPIVFFRGIRVREIPLSNGSIS